MTRIGDTNQAHLTQQLLRNALTAPNGANPTSPAGAAEAHRADTTATRADRLPALLGRVSTLEQADVRFSTLNDSFDAIDETLRAARAAITSGGDATDQLATAQQTIDKTLASIDTLLNAESAGALSLLRDGVTPFLTATDRDDTISRLRVRGEIPGGAESLDVQLEITASAQQGALALSFGSTFIDLSAAAATFQIEIAGTRGSRELSFASGTAISEIRNAINTFREETGVSAATSGQNIRLDSRELGDDQFVSVRILDDGGQAGGVIRYNERDTNEAASISSFNASEATGGITDIGQDIGVLYNGQALESEGLRVNLQTEGFSASFDLTLERSWLLGEFDAFTLSTSRDALDTAPVRDALSAIDTANPSAESIDTLLSALDSLSGSINQLHESAVREPLAGLIAELRAGSAPPPTQNALEALRNAVSGTDPRDASALLKGSS